YRFAFPGSHCRNRPSDDPEENCRRGPDLSCALDFRKDGTAARRSFIPKLVRRRIDGHPVHGNCGFPLTNDGGVSTVVIKRLEYDTGDDVVKVLNNVPNIPNVVTAAIEIKITLM